MRSVLMMCLLSVLSSGLTATVHAADEKPKPAAPPDVSMSHAKISDNTIQALAKDSWNYFSGEMTDAGKGWVCQNSVRLSSDKTIGIISVKFKTVKEGAITIGCCYDENRVLPSLRTQDPQTNFVQFTPVAKSYQMTANSRECQLFTPKVYLKDFVSVNNQGIIFKKGEIVHTMAMTYNGTEVEYYLDDKRVRAERSNTSPGKFVFEADAGAEILELKLMAK